MKNLFLFTLLLLSPFPAFADESTGNVNLTLGSRNYSNESYWGSELKTQPSAMLKYDFGYESWPINVVVGFASSSKTAYGYVWSNNTLVLVNLKTTVSELFGGVQKNWAFGATRPFLGIGVTTLTFKGDVNATNGWNNASASQTSSSVGFYIDGGIYWRLGDHFNVGIDGRIVTSTS